MDTADRLHDDALLDVEGAAALLAVDANTVRRLAKRGAFPWYTVTPDAIRYRVGELRAYVDSQRNYTAVCDPTSATHSPGAQVLAHRALPREGKALRGAQDGRRPLAQRVRSDSRRRPE